MSERFVEVEAAHKWGLPPSQFWSLSKGDQAYMIAYLQARAGMDAYQAQVDAAEMEARAAEAKAKRGR